jgi:hypothetical protein
MSAWIHAGVLYIATPYETREVPATGFGKTDTLPSRSASNPPHTGSTAPGSSPQGGSDPPQAPAPPTDADPEPPNPLPKRAKLSREKQGEGLDDFTAIDGVGPVTAQKLHDAGFYVYDDLRNTPGILNDLVGTRTADKIRAWLDQRAEAHRADREVAASVSA